MRPTPLLALALCMAGSVASAQAVDVTWKCTPLGTPTALMVGDVAGHAFVIDQGKCTAVKGSPLGGVQHKEGTVTEFADATGNNEFKGATGGGSCKGTGNADGSSTFDCKGNITAK